MRMNCWVRLAARIVIASTSLAFARIPVIAQDPDNRVEVVVRAEFEEGLETDKWALLGDMLLPVRAGVGLARGAVLPEIPLWPDGVVPFVFSSTVPETLRQAVISAMSEWGSATGVRFTPAAAREPRLRITLTEGNSRSYVGYHAPTLPRGSQRLFLRPDATRYEILHELGHALGLSHEHQRSDRDDYVSITFLPGASEWSSSQVGIVEELQSCTPYDPASIMHYRFGRYDNFEIRPRASGGEGVVQRDRLSSGDAAVVRRLYSGSGCEVHTSLRRRASQWLHIDRALPLVRLQRDLSDGRALEVYAQGGGRHVMVTGGSRAGSVRRARAATADFLRGVWRDQQVIEEIGWTGTEFLVAASAVGGQARQSATIGELQRSDFRELTDGGWSLTTLAHSPEGWVVIYTEDPGLDRQTWSRSEDFPHRFIAGQQAVGGIVTALAYGAGQWVAVVSRGTPFREQVVLTGLSFPAEQIRSALERGFQVVDIDHGPAPTGWAVVMAR